MKKIGIVVGHGPNIDRGAVNANGTTELDWNRELAHFIGLELKGKEGIQFQIISRRIEKLSPVAEINAYNPDIVIELHLNGSDDEDPDLEGEATGTEMVFSGSQRSGALAKVLLDAAVGVLQLRNRGVILPWKGRGARFLKKTNMPAVIVESFFIDHTPDLQRGNQVKKELAKAYADALVKFLQ